jgi:hypothetical protein
MWQKTYEVRIPGPTPEAVIATWKAKFGEFWYPSNRFYAPAGGIAPGAVAVIGGGVGPAKINTGVRVIYADERSWSYMNPEGHPWAGIITFSSHEAEDGVTVAKVHLMVRANDPLYELSFKIYTSRMEDKIWNYTLRQVAAHFGVTQPEVDQSVVLIDKRRQWNQMSNLWKNSAVRTLLRRDGLWHEPSPGHYRPARTASFLGRPGHSLEASSNVRALRIRFESRRHRSVSAAEVPTRAVS